jgi:MFS family permease
VCVCVCVCACANVCVCVCVSPCASHILVCTRLKHPTRSHVAGFLSSQAYVLEVANLKPSLAALLLLVTQLYDAVLDPVAGLVTDRVRTPWGRRRPWILFCGICMSISYFFLWQSPSTISTQLNKFFYYLCIILVWHTFMSFTYVPYVALAGELTHEYDERTSLTTYRFVFGLGSGLLFTFAQGLLVEVFPDPNDPELVDYQLGYTVAAGLFGFLFIAPFLVLFFGVHDDGSSVERLIKLVMERECGRVGERLFCLCCVCLYVCVCMCLCVCVCVCVCVLCCMCVLCCICVLCCMCACTLLPNVLSSLFSENR